MKLKLALVKASHFLDPQRGNLGVFPHSSAVLWRLGVYRKRNRARILSSEVWHRVFWYKSTGVSYIRLPPSLESKNELRKQEVFSETSLNYPTTRHQIIKESILHSYRCENLCEKTAPLALCVSSWFACFAYSFTLKTQAVRFPEI